MKKNLLYIMLILSVISCRKKDALSDAQADKFVKYFGSFSNDNSNRMLQTSDEGFIIVGTVSSLTQGKEAAFIKTDKFGNEEWSTTFGDSLDNYANSILIEDDGFLVVGTTTDSSLTTNMWLLKLTNKGYLQWKKSYGNIYDEEGISLVKSNESGYILAGTTTQPEGNNLAGNRDIYYVKISETGKIIWEYQSGLAGNESTSQIIAYNDGYAIIGSSETSGNNGLGGVDIQLLLINETGSVTDSKTFGGSSNDFGNGIQNTADGFIIIGTSSSFGNSSEIFVTSIKQDIYTTNWENTYGSEEIETGNFLIPTSSGNFLVLGSTEEDVQKAKDQYILNISSTGEVIWENKYGYTGDDIANYAIETTDGGFAILGTTSIGNNQMVSLIKTDSEGKITN